MRQPLVHFAGVCLVIATIGIGTSKAQNVKRLEVEVGISSSQFTKFDKGDKVKFVMEGDHFRIHDTVLERARLEVVRETDNTASITIIAKFKSGKLAASGSQAQITDLTCGFNLVDFNCVATNIIGNPDLRGHVIRMEMVKK